MVLQGAVSLNIFIHTIAELFIMCMKKSYLTSCWKFLSVIPVFGLENRSTAKNYCPVSVFLCLVKSLRIL